jgi:hypothetical protein
MDVQEHSLGGVTWFWLSRQFESNDDAKRAWERLHAATKGLESKMQLGIYRHGPTVAETRYVTAVSSVSGGVKTAGRLLRGKPVDLPTDIIESLILRRVSVVAHALETHHEPGRLTIRRGSRGAHLRRDGTMDENINHD